MYVLTVLFILKYVCLYSLRNLKSQAPLPVWPVTGR